MLDLDQDPTAARDKYRKELELYGIDPNFFEDAKKQNINIYHLSKCLADVLVLDVI